MFSKNKMKTAIRLNKDVKKQILQEILAFVINKDIKYLSKNTLIYLKLARFSAFTYIHIITDGVNYTGDILGYNDVLSVFRANNINDIIHIIQRQASSHINKLDKPYINLYPPNLNYTFLKEVCKVILEPNKYKYKLSNLQKI